MLFFKVKWFKLLCSKFIIIIFLFLFLLLFCKNNWFFLFIKGFFECVIVFFMGFVIILIVVFKNFNLKNNFGEKFKMFLNLFFIKVLKGVFWLCIIFLKMRFGLVLVFKNKFIVRFI